MKFLRLAEPGPVRSASAPTVDRGRSRIASSTLSALAVPRPEVAQLLGVVAKRREETVCGVDDVSPDT